MISTDNVAEVIGQLQAAGMVFTQGLTEDQLNRIEEHAGGRIPQDLRALLHAGVPIRDAGQPGAMFPRWDESLSDPIEEYNKFIEELFLFDVEEGGFWHETLGDKPADKEAREHQVLSVLRKQPRFIPVRFAQIGMLAGNDDGPVLSYHGPLDTIGWVSLESYFKDRFGIDLKKGATEPTEFGRLPFWTEIFEASYKED